ncbi:hypothetical protein SU65_07690 [Flavobacterium psychrophilum]|nr:hypothetical protein SU65_07690 [Flavobacterium psychrophilum]
MGLTSKYKWNNNINLYGQFLLDEFSLGEVKSGEKSWKNWHKAKVLKTYGLWLMAYHLKIVSKNKLKKTRKNA